MRMILLICLMHFPFLSFAQEGRVYACTDGKVAFTSDAPLELIKADSEKLTGALNLESRTFSFSVASSSFQGFNSSLQRIHFNEDYMESELYPNSTFKGKIIEETDLSVPGNYTIRAKGKLYIHGVQFDRIIRCTMEVKHDRIVVSSSFTVFLDDHDISIPSIVNQKIAEEIMVDVDLTLSSR